MKEPLQVSATGVERHSPQLNHPYSKDFLKQTRLMAHAYETKQDSSENSLRQRRKVDEPRTLENSPTQPRKISRDISFISIATSNLDIAQNHVAYKKSNPLLGPAYYHMNQSAIEFGRNSSHTGDPMAHTAYKFPKADRDDYQKVGHFVMPGHQESSCLLNRYDPINTDKYKRSSVDITRGNRFSQGEYGNFDTQWMKR
jgi:hypothetical protein